MSDTEKKADADCECVGCAISRLLNERFPDGYGAAETTECLTGISKVAGWLLAAAGDRTMQAFVTLLVQERELRRADAQRASSLH